MAKVDEALEKALSLIDENGLGIEDCLAVLSAPEADRLRPLLQTVLAVKDRARTAPAPVRREENKAVFLAELAALRATDAVAENYVERITAPFSDWLRTRLGHAVAAATAAVVLTGGVATAAGRSGPASPLYPVKRAVEAVETALPRSDSAQANLRLELAETRLAELERAEDREDAAYKRLYAEFNDELFKAKNLAARLSYVEHRQAYSRYEELERRYKNVSHRRLEEPGESAEENESNHGVEAPPADDSALPSNQDDEVKAGDGGTDDGENSGSQAESKPDQNVGDSDDGSRNSNDEAVRNRNYEQPDDNGEKAEARRRRQKRDDTHKAQEKNSSLERRESGDDRDEGRD